MSPFVIIALRDKTVSTHKTSAIKNISSIPTTPAVPIPHPIFKNRITPMILRQHGMKQPLNVPRAFLCVSEGNASAPSSSAWPMLNVRLMLLPTSGPLRVEANELRLEYTLDCCPSSGVLVLLIDIVTVTEEASSDDSSESPANHRPRRRRC